MASRLSRLSSSSSDSSSSSSSSSSNSSSSGVAQNALAHPNMEYPSAGLRPTLLRDAMYNQEDYNINVVYDEKKSKPDQRSLQSNLVTSILNLIGERRDAGKERGVAHHYHNNSKLYKKIFRTAADQLIAFNRIAAGNGILRALPLVSDKNKINFAEMSHIAKFPAQADLVLRFTKAINLHEDWDHPFFNDGMKQIESVPLIDLENFVEAVELIFQNPLSRFRIVLQYQGSSLPPSKRLLITQEFVIEIVKLLATHSAHCENIGKGINEFFQDPGLNETSAALNEILIADGENLASHYMQQILTFLEKPSEAYERALFHLAICHYYPKEDDYIKWLHFFGTTSFHFFKTLDDPKTMIRILVEKGPECFLRFNSKDIKILDAALCAMDYRTTLEKTRFSRIILETSPADLFDFLLANPFAGKLIGFFCSMIPDASFEKLAEWWSKLMGMEPTKREEIAEILSIYKSEKRRFTELTFEAHLIDLQAKSITDFCVERLKQKHPFPLSNQDEVLFKNMVSLLENPQEQAQHFTYFLLADPECATHLTTFTEHANKLTEICKIIDFYTKEHEQKLTAQMEQEIKKDQNYRIYLQNKREKQEEKTREMKQRGIEIDEKEIKPNPKRKPPMQEAEKYLELLNFRSAIASKFVRILSEKIPDKKAEENRRAVSLHFAYIIENYKLYEKFKMPFSSLADQSILDTPYQELKVAGPRKIGNYGGKPISHHPLADAVCLAIALCGRLHMNGAHYIKGRSMPIMPFDMLRYIASFLEGEIRASRDGIYGHPYGLFTYTVSRAFQPPNPVNKNQRLPSEVLKAYRESEPVRKQSQRIYTRTDTYRAPNCEFKCSFLTQPTLQVLPVPEVLAAIPIHPDPDVVAAIQPQPPEENNSSKRRRIK